MNRPLFIVHFKVFTLVATLLSTSQVTHAEDGGDAAAWSLAVEADVADVELRGAWLLERERLDTAFVNGIEVDRLLHNFRVTAGLPSTAEPMTGWEAPQCGLRGHFTGHYLSTLAMLVHRYADPAQTRRLNALVEGLAECQRLNGNGYLSAFPETELETLETRVTHGVWAPYYTLHKLMQGLLDAYLLAGNQTAWEIVCQMADYIDRRMSRLPDDTHQRLLQTRQANPANEAGAMNELLYRLYTVSHDERHLRLAQMFDPDWLALPLARGEDILSGLHANTHLVLVNGFAARYGQTGETTYRDATLRFWDLLMTGHAYVNGSSSGPRPNATTRTAMTAEHWGEAGHLSNTLSSEIAESCVSHNTLRLASYLFAWTADPRYADAAQNLFYNAVLPVQSASTGQVTYHLPLGSPRTKKYLKPTDYYCCSGSSMEAFTRLGAGIYWLRGDTLLVNRLQASALHLRQNGMTVEQTGTFPLDSVVTLRMHTRRPCRLPIKVLVPEWEGSPARYMTFDRQWRDGDSIRIELHPRFRIASLAGNDHVVAVCYGPLVLAFEGDEELTFPVSADELLAALQVDDLAAGRFSLTLGSRTYTLRPLFDIDSEPYSVYITINP